MLFRLKLDIDTLVTTMLDQIPQDRLIHGKVIDLSMGGGQFIREVERRKQAAGLTSRQIHDTLIGIAADEMDLSFFNRRYKLKGQYVHGNALEMDWKNMKFDVVIGNPPYQVPGSDSSDKLWPSFITKAIEWCRPGGYIAYITPSSWMSPNKVFTMMNDKKLLWVNTDIEKYFPGIGSTFSAWIMKNEPGNETAIIDGVKIDWSKLGLIPNDRSSIAMSILNKFLTRKDKIEYECTHINDRRRDHVSENKSAEFKYPIFYTNTQVLWTSIRQDNMGKKKVIVSDSGYWQPIYNEEMGTGAHGWYFKVKSKKQGQNLIGILTSKLFKFALMNTKYSGFFLRTVFDKFPAVDSTRSWTDADLYEHFGLTKKEVAYIEARVTTDMKV